MPTGMHLGGDKTKLEHIAIAAVVAFQHGLPERRVRMQRNLLVLRANHVVHDARCRGTVAAVAKPFFGCGALHNTAWIMDTTVHTGVLR